MSVEPREIGEAAKLRLSHQIALNSFLSKDKGFFGLLPELIGL